jgi:hypothetical protein
MITIIILLTFLVIFIDLFENSKYNINYNNIIILGVLQCLVLYLDLKKMK